MKDLEHLIRQARPQVDPLAARRAILDVVPGFETPTVPVPWVRIAAALVVACAAGFAASAWLGRPATSPVDPEISAVERKIAELDRRLSQNTGPAAAELADLNRRADDLQRRPALPLEQAIARSVAEVAARRHQEKLEQQRESHLAYVRKRYEQDVDRSLSRLKRDYNLNEAKEAELRAVFSDHGAQVQKLISRNYGGKTRSLKGEFAAIKRETDARVQSVLSEVPLNMPGGDLAEWGPDPDYETLSDYESIQRWREEAQQPG